MIDQDSSGIMYFVNNEGLLEFNGFDWSVYPLPNKSVIRSLKAVKDRVYVGGFNELGFFERDNSGSLRYNSLIELLPENQRDFSDTWKIHLIGNDIVYQSVKSIMYFNGTEFYRIIPGPVLFHFSFSLGGELYVNDIENGMYRVAPEKFVLMPGLEVLKGKEIWGMEVLSNGILFATSDDGIFLYKDFAVQEWKVEVTDFLKKNQIYSLLRLLDDKFAIGTIQNGLVICNNQGNIIKTLNRENGLQNNTILSLKQDSYSNLWLGLDNGIDYLQINSPFSYFTHSDGLSAGYASLSITVICIWALIRAFLLSRGKICIKKRIKVISLLLKRQEVRSGV